MSIKAQFFEVERILSEVNLFLLDGSKNVKHAFAPTSIFGFSKLNMDLPFVKDHLAKIQDARQLQRLA